MKLNQAYSRSGRRLLLRPPESGQNTGPEPPTREQTAGELAKRGVRMRHPRNLDEQFRLTGGPRGRKS